ncbi:MAG: SRPBCC family protein [Candidatus Saccharimonadales bacterium]
MPKTNGIIDTECKRALVIKVTIKTKVTISAEPSIVFRYLKELKYHYLWNPHIQKISPITSLSAGLEYKSESILLGVRVKGVNRVIKVVENREIQLENKTGTIQYQVKYYLSKHQKDKTKLLYTITVNTDNKIFAYSAEIIKILAKRELRSDMEALKIASENRLKANY